MRALTWMSTDSAISTMTFVSTMTTSNTPPKSSQTASHALIAVTVVWRNTGYTKRCRERIINSLRISLTSSNVTSRNTIAVLEVEGASWLHGHADGVVLTAARIRVVLMVEVERRGGNASEYSRGRGPCLLQTDVDARAISIFSSAGCNSSASGKPASGIRLTSGDIP